MTTQLEHKGSILIHSARIILRPFVLDDALLMYKNWAKDPDVTRYMTWFPHKDITETKSVISQWADQYAKANFYQWAIVLKETNKPIGSIGIVELDEDSQSGEIGYCIGKQYWHQGYTSEALRTVLDFLINFVKFRTLTARHDIRNPNSGGVMRKCGMKYVKTCDNIGLTKEGEPLVCAYYSISKDNLQ